MPTVTPRTAAQRLAEPTLRRAPACMEPDELEAWSETNRRMSVGRAVSPCDDCSLGFAIDMRREGRCNGRPGGVEEDEEMTEVRVVLKVPCETCSHAPVCRLKEQLEAIAGVDVALPLIDKVIAVSLQADASCGHYAKAKGAKPLAAAPAQVSGWTPERRARQSELMRGRNNAERHTQKAGEAA